jgi:hypothetical protein
MVDVGCGGASAGTAHAASNPEQRHLAAGGTFNSDPDKIHNRTRTWEESDIDHA